MKIPLIYADKPYEVVHTPNVGVGEMAEAQVGGEVVELSGLIAQRQAVLQERERLAQETLKAVETDTEMNKRMAKEKEFFLTNPNYETYDARKQEFLNSLKDEFSPKEGSSNEAKIAFARSFNKFSNEFGDFVSARKYKVMEDRSLSAINDLMVQKGEEYAALTDPRDKELKIKSTELAIRRLMDTGAISELVGENKIRDIEKTFKAMDVDGAKASATNRMSVDPARLAVDLKDPNYLPEWKDKSERAVMARQAETAARIQENEREAKRKEALQKAEEAEKIAIGNKYLMGDYTGAYADLQRSKVISNKIEIGNQIRAASERVTPPDPTMSAITINKANQMIASDEDPEKIREFITFNPNLVKADKEQYLNKLQENLNADIKTARAKAYRDISSIIFPRAFDIMGIDPNMINEETINKLLNASKISPKQVVGIRQTQDALDRWITSQIKAGKYPSSTEITNKGFELTAIYQMSIGEKVDWYRNQGME